MKVLALIALVFFFSCKPSKGRLEGKVQTLELSYVNWACECANWATSSDLAKYENNELADHCIYVEPVSPTVALPDSIGYINDKVRFTGQFYNKKGFPEGYSSEQSPEPARVFRYTAYKILQSNHKQAKLQMLNSP